MSENKSRPKVGIGVYIFRDGKVLIGKRFGKHGQGTWSPPGGHLEMGEEWEACARREALEESGVVIKNVRFATATNDVIDTDTHYVTLHCVAEWDAGEPTVKEPEKMGEWRWFAIEELPEPLFGPARNFLKSGYNPLNF